MMIRILKQFGIGSAFFSAVLAAATVAKAIGSPPAVIAQSVPSAEVTTTPNGTLD
jgi:hypothetical protein